MKRIIPILFVFISLVSCQKDFMEEERNLWELSSFKVSYFDNKDNKVFEENPSELALFKNIRLYKDGFSIIENPEAKIAMVKSIKDKELKASEAALMSFSGKVNYEGIILKWTTVEEANNSHFVLQRSNDGAGFMDLGKIKGIGNSDQENKYEFLDIDPFKGVNYYRLTQVDYNGKEYYFPIIAVTTIPLVNNEYSLIRDDKYYYFPVPIYVDKFRKVEINREGDNFMKWESKEMDVSYLKDNIKVKAAYAKLLMEFNKLK